jgi:two-component system response regulator
VTEIILLVEDNAIDEELTILALRKAKIQNEIVVTRDGAEALDYLFATGAHAGRNRRLPQLVLLDLNLPTLDGLEVLRRIRATPRTTMLPVVILTSSNESRDVSSSYRAGANSYIVKPVDFHEFSESVRQLGTYWLGLNVPTA